MSKSINLRKISPAVLRSDYCSVLEEHLAAQLREQRKSLDMTQLHLSFKTCISPSTISLVEHGRVFSDFRKFFIICEALNVLPEELLWSSCEYCRDHYNAIVAGGDHPVHADDRDAPVEESEDRKKPQ